MQFAKNRHFTQLSSCTDYALPPQETRSVYSAANTIDITAIKIVGYGLRSIRTIEGIHACEGYILVKASVWARRLPWSIVVATMLLMALGWLGIARVEELSIGRGRFLGRQLLFSIIALAAMLLATIPSYRTLCRLSYPLFLLAIVLLMVVYRCPAINGAHRWIRVGRVGFQPSDLAKLAFVLALARYLMYRENYRRLRGLLGPLALTLLPVLLILKEPDLGTSLVLLPVFLAMLFAAGAKRSDLALRGAGGPPGSAVALDANEPQPEVADYGPVRSTGAGSPAERTGLPTVSGQAGACAGRRLG